MIAMAGVWSSADPRLRCAEDVADLPDKPVIKAQSRISSSLRKTDPSRKHCLTP
jgi:hypothetical protein